MKRIFLVTFLVALSFLSSCGIYSLFPIVTDKNRTFIPEFMGEWEAISDPATKFVVGKTRIVMLAEEEYEVNEELGNIRIYYDSLGRDNKTYTRLIENDKDIHSPSAKELEIALRRIEERMKNADIPKQKARMDEFYRLSQYKGNSLLNVFLVHLASINDQVFMDMYPSMLNLKDHPNGGNVFPVHSFSKIELDGGELIMREFNSSRLKDLFKSNRVRLKHEIVDDEILITAGTSDIIKFFGTYARDEDVYENASIFTRVTGR